MLIAFLIAMAVGASKPSLVEKYGQECVDKAHAYADSRGYWGADWHSHFVLTYLETNCGGRNG